ncbi:hypothetical protein JTB14_036943 [Gonioctena quinquepunctata]|nr:hypothetical protein JTB14_036943 [Gonioctena quinquepunctata]
MNEYLEEYINRTTITRPARIRFAAQLHEMNFQPPPTITIGPAEIAPWLYTKPNIRFDLAPYQKSHTSPIQYRMEFNKLIASFQESTIIYTDGSKTNNGVGSSFEIKKRHITGTSMSINHFTAEQYAIWQALLYILFINDVNNRYIIACDSRSVLQELENIYSKDPLTHHFLNFQTQIHEQGKELTFTWIPRHVGIRGNEKADSAAKMGSDKHETDANFIKPTDLKLYLKKCIRDKWEQECLTINTHLNTIKNNVRRWNPPLKLNRKDRIRIQRLRKGHTNITHKHLLTDKKMEDIERKLQDTVTTIAQSTENQGFRISVNKTYCRLRKVHQEPRMKLYGADIKIKSSGKFLGLIFIGIGSCFGKIISQIWL